MNNLDLQLPNDYVNIEENEMEYVSGGDGTLSSSITGLGTLAITMGMFMWTVGSYHKVSSVQSRGIMTAIVGASLVGSAYVTTIEKTAWNSIKVHYSGKLHSGGAFVG